MKFGVQAVQPWDWNPSSENRSSNRGEVKNKSKRQPHLIPMHRHEFDNAKVGRNEDRICDSSCYGRWN